MVVQFNSLVIAILLTVSLCRRAKQTGGHIDLAPITMIVTTTAEMVLWAWIFLCAFSIDFNLEVPTIAPEILYVITVFLLFLWWLSHVWR